MGFLVVMKAGLHHYFQDIDRNLVFCPAISLHNYYLHRQHHFRLRRGADGDWKTQGGAGTERRRANAALGVGRVAFVAACDGGAGQDGAVGGGGREQHRDRAASGLEQGPRSASSAGAYRTASGRPARRIASGTAAQLPPRAGGGTDQPGAAQPAQERHPPERALGGRRNRHLQEHGGALLRTLRPATSSRQELQALHRPVLRGKGADVAGLYLNPPDKALVRCVDEKSQIQALERTQPVLPMGLGYVEGVTHYYYRHGTTTLFAALDVLDGSVIPQCKPCHRHQEFRAFLNDLERNVPLGLAVHLIADNYGTHKHPRVKAWLARHPRFHVHYTPTYASWLNQVERWFALITQQAIRRGSFKSVRELVDKIDQYVAHHNLRKRPLRLDFHRRLHSSKGSTAVVNLLTRQNTSLG